jgi:hypothetical protein
VAAAVIALVGLFLGVRTLLSPAPGRMDVLMLVVCLLPGAVLLGALPRAGRPVGALLLPVGAVVLVAGGLLASRSYSMDLSLATLGWWYLIAFGSGLVPFPLGLALVSAGAGLLLGRRWLLVVALLLAALVAGWFTGATLAGPVSMADTSGFWLDKGALIVTGIFAVVTCFLLALAAASRSVLGDLSVGPARSPRRRGRALMAAALVTVAVAAAVGGWWFQFAPRLVLEEVFPDLALARCVAGELGEQDTGNSVSRSDLGRVLSLACNGDLGGADVQDTFRMHSLEGVDRLENLASLDLTGNRVGDLGPLVGLEKLGQLTLTGNEVSDLSPLAMLPVLSDLGLSNNRISDVGPLADVPTLRLLGLAGNGISDLTPLAGLSSLTELDLGRNAIDDVSPLSGLTRLDRLELADNQVTDVTPLGRLVVLTRLDIAGNRVADVSGLTGCRSLGELRLGRNPIADVSPLWALPALTGVDLEGVDPTTPGVTELRARGVYVGGFA